MSIENKSKMSWRKVTGAEGKMKTRQMHIRNDSVIGSKHKKGKVGTEHQQKGNVGCKYVE